MQDKTIARDNLTLATAGMTSKAVALLSLKEVGAMVKVEGLSAGFLRNLQRSMVARVKGREMADVASAIVKRMKGDYPDIAAIPNRDRTIKVWLDGLPEEIDL